MSYTIAGIDVHKKVLMVVVFDVEAMAEKPERARFGTTASERQRLLEWLQEREVQEAVMESTAQYWKPIWYGLEGHLQLHLAQAFSNRAPRGRKRDFRDAERLARRLVAQELFLSFVPPPEQRVWRTITRTKVQLARDRVRLHSQLEGLLEEMRIKLSSVITDLLGASGLRILQALADGQTDPQQLAELGSEQLHCSEEQLIDALTGQPEKMHLELLKLYLQRLRMIDEQLEKLNQLIAEAMKAHEEVVVRLAEVTGFGVDSAQQVIAEVGPRASTFDSAAQLTSWAGTCPGKEESAEENHNSRSAKGNKYLRRVLTEVAQAAVKTKGSHYQIVFRRLLPRLGYKQALWAVVHRLCRLVWKILHEQLRFVEQSKERDPKAAQQRAKTLTRALRRLGYNVQITPISPAPAQG